MPEDQWREAVGHIQAETPIGKLTTITGKQLRNAAKRMGRRKAPGADGLQGVDWSWWPLEHWDHLAQMLAVCEASGRWPDQLRIAHVALLSKGGKPVDGLQARPITILPLVYRAGAIAKKLNSRPLYWPQP